MDILIMTGQLILALTILVAIHELGHFSAAKWFKMRVDRFFIFFDPWFRLWGKKIGETLYGIGWLPLGGYVKIAGMVDESMDTEQLKKPPEPWEFRAKPAWQRLIVMVGGVTMNVILGMLVFVFLTYIYGEQYLSVDKLNKHGIVAKEFAQEAGFKTGDKIVAVNGEKIKKFSEVTRAATAFDKQAVISVVRDGERHDIQIPENFTDKILEEQMNWQQKFMIPRTTFKVKRVVKGSPAEKAGLKAGDSIMAINGQSIKFFDQAQSIIDKHAGEKLLLLIERDGSQKQLNVDVNEEGNIGFMADMQLPYDHNYFGFGTSIVQGSSKAWETLFANIAGIGKIVSGEVSARHIMGPIGIATIYGSKWDWYQFWSLTGILSMWLAFINIVPIPALDGGHVLFISYEMISGRKPSQRFVEATQMAGMVLLLALMIFVIGNDIFNLFR